jgi:predicted transcriptional regulator
MLPDGTHLRTGRELNVSRSVIDPVTRSGRYAYDNRFLEVRGESMQLVSADLAATVSARKMDGHLDGHGSWHGIEGSSTLANSTLPPAQDALDTAGSFEVHAASDARGTAWRVQGEASTLSVDLVAWLKPSAIAGGTAVGVGLLAFLLGTQLRSAITFVLGRTTPGILRARPLDSRTRKTILQAIHEQQPITLVHLQERTGLARGTLRYHLRVLSSCELLQVLPPSDGVERNMTYMLNSNSLLFDTQGIAEPAQDAAAIKPGKVLAAVNSSPIRRAIYDFLLDHGPADFDAIRAHILFRGLAVSWPQSTASHQLRQLEEARAVVATWQNRRKVYAANLDPQDARVGQYTHYLQSNGVAWLAKRLHTEGPLTLDELWATSPKTGSSRRELRHQLEQLAATVLLAYDPATKKYRLERTLDSLVPHILGRLNIG